jgi:hypothetical protein
MAKWGCPSWAGGQRLEFGQYLVLEVDKRSLLALGDPLTEGHAKYRHPGRGGERRRRLGDVAGPEGGSDGAGEAGHLEQFPFLQGGIR